MADTGDRVRRSALIELTLARIKEALRDPGALFWTFAFPVLLAIVLGFAFRNAPPERQRVAVACALPADTCAQLVARIGREPVVSVTQLPLPSALPDLGRGKLDLVIEVVQ